MRVQSAEERRFRLRPKRPERLASVLVAQIVVIALIYGWMQRHAEWLDPEDGIGYYLGIAGASMMLLLLSYPLRKRSKAMKSAGSIGFWFRFHMLLGLLGPLTILYHSRFSWGALNSGIALAAMLTVMTSGLVGRFLYSRVHQGYSDRKLEIRELKRGMDRLLNDLARDEIGKAEVIARLHDLEDRAVAAGSSFIAGAQSVFGLGFRTRLMERKLMRDMPPANTERGEALRKCLADFFEAVRRASEFAFYNRLLRLWHYLHLPLFIVLVGAAILHIIAVHQY